MIRLPHILVVILTISCAFNVFAQENTKQSSLAVLVDYNSEGKDLAEKLQLLLEEEVTLQWLGQFVKFSDFNKLLQELKISASGIEDKVNKSILINQTIKLAIIADKTSGLDNSLLVSLLEMELSQTEGIQVLERAQIDKILREQQLSISGLLDRDTILKVGRLLRANAFVILSVESTENVDAPRQLIPREQTDEIAEEPENQDLGKLIRLRVVETAHGLRLCDSFEQLGEAELEQNSDRILNKIKDVVSKLSLPAGKAIPVGIVDIHRVQLSERYKLLERALPVMLSVRLGREPRIIMLEREDLNLLQKEKILTEGQDTEFWGSAVLIDGYIQPNGIDTIELKLQLRQSAGNDQTSFTVLVDPNQPSIAIDLAANKIIKNLQNSPPSTQWQPELEAEEFYRQGAMLVSHRRYEDAAAPLETAHAFQSGNLTYTTALFKDEWEPRIYSRKNSPQSDKPFLYSDLELAELASLLVLQIQRDYEQNDFMDARFLYDTWGTLLGIRLKTDSYFASLASVSSEHIKLINRKNRRVWFEIMARAMRERHPSVGYPFPSAIANLVWVGFDDPDELFVKLKEVYREIIFPPSMGGIIRSNNTRYSNCHRGILQDCRDISLLKYNRSHLSGSEERVLSLWYNCLEELSKIEDPIIKYYSHLAQAECLEYDRQLNRPDLIKEQFLKASDVMVNELLVSNGLLRDSTKRSLCYRFKRSLKIMLTRDNSLFIEIHKRICEALIEKNDAIALSCWEPGRESIPIDRSILEPASAKDYYELLEKIVLILQTEPSNEKQINRALGVVRDCQADIRLLYPQLDLKQKRSAFTSTMLLKKEDWPETFPSGFSAIQMKLKKNFLYVVTAPEDSPMMFSIIDIAQKKINALYQIELTIYPRYLTGLAIGNNNCFASITGTGLVVLPGAFSNGREMLSNVKILTPKDGLPSINVTGVAENNNQLWIAYGGPEEECGLGLYDPDTRHWETYFCSTIKGDSPLSSGQPYGSGLIQLTPASSDKLYFLIDRTMIANMRKWVGLWKMNINTRELKYLGNCGLSECPIGYLENDRDEIWCKGGSTLIRFIANSEEAFYVLGQYWNPDMRERKYLRPSEREIRPPWINCQNDLFIPETSFNQISFGPFDKGLLDLSTSAIHGNLLWALLGKSQIVILQQGKPWEQAEIINNDILDGEPVYRFVSTPYGLIAIGNGTVGLIETESD